MAFDQVDKGATRNVRPFLLPQTHLDSRDFKVNKAAKDASKRKRKSETDAISKEFIKIRAEGGFRLNQVRRLRQKYLEVVEFVKDNEYPLPFEFSYIENKEREDRSKELFLFRLWDKPSFVLHHSKIILTLPLIMQRGEELLFR